MRLVRGFGDGPDATAMQGSGSGVADGTAGVAADAPLGASARDGLDAAGGGAAGGGAAGGETAAADLDGSTERRLERPARERERSRLVGSVIYVDTEHPDFRARWRQTRQACTRTSHLAGPARVAAAP